MFEGSDNADLLVEGTDLAHMHNFSSWQCSAIKEHYNTKIDHSIHAHNLSILLLFTVNYARGPTCPSSSQSSPCPLGGMYKYQPIKMIVLMYVGIRIHCSTVSARFQLLTISYNKFRHTKFTMTTLSCNA